MSTISLTLLSYSLLFSLYICAATLLAGDKGFGSDKRDLKEVNMAHTSYTGLHWFWRTKIRQQNTVKANTSVFVNVWMEHFRLEHHIRRLVGVLLCEFELKFEQSSLPWSSLDTLNDGFPLKQIVLEWSGANAFVFLFFNFLKIFQESALGCCGHLYFVFINFYKSQTL